MPKPLELLQGTLDMLILKAVSLGLRHGYGIWLRIHKISGNRLQIQQRSLYLALYHLERRTHRERGESGNKRKAKWYRLTAGGRRTLQAKIKNWNSMAEVIAGVLNAQPEKL